MKISVRNIGGNSGRQGSSVQGTNGDVKEIKGTLSGVPEQTPQDGGTVLRDEAEAGGLGHMVASKHT